MSYKEFKVEDFVQDAWFRTWVNGNDPDSNVFWEKWLLENPKERKKIEQARKIVRSLSHLEEPMPMDRKKAVWKAISANTVKPYHVHKRPHKERINEELRYWLRATLKLAAAFLFIMATVYVFTAIRDSVNEFKMAENSKPDLFQKETALGQRISFRLPDGSLVYLNSGSKVIYEVGQGGVSREVFLQGEAFFIVNKDEKRPFKVFANATEITALGTEFNVKIGNADSTTEISLVEGTVEVVNLASENKDRLYLNEGERAFLVPSEKTMTKSIFDIGLVTFWTNGLLLFEDTSILTVKEILEQWYGIQIVFQNKHEADLKVTGRFDNEYLGNVLQSLSYTVRFDYEVKDKTVYIKFKQQ